MERNRETRRASVLGSNGVNTRRHGRTNTLKENPYGDGGVELQESARLRREGVKRDRERKRERRRDFRERRSRGKRRRGDETSDESFDEEDDEEDEDDEDEDDDEEENRTAAARFFPPLSVSLPRRRLHRRKSFPLGTSSSSSSKDFKSSPVWKSSDDETFTPLVPRKPRSASTKRSRDWISSRSSNTNGGVSDQILRQASTSPARQSGVVSAPPPNSFKKKLKPDEYNTGPKQEPPKASNPEKLEIEIAEVLFGLMTQSQCPSSNPRSIGGRKSSTASDPGPLQAVAPKRMMPAEDPARSGRPGLVETYPAPKREVLSPDPEKVSSGELMGNSVISHKPEEIIPKEDMDYQQESDAVKNDEDDSPSIATASSTSAVVPGTMTKPSSTTPAMENRRIEQINLMALPPEDSILSTDLSCSLSAGESEEKREESKTKKEIDNNTRKVCLHFDLETPGVPEDILQQHQEIPTKQKVEEEEPLPSFSQPRPKRCATHCYVARNIHRLQKLIKTGSLWELPSGPVGNVGPSHGPKDKVSQNATSFVSPGGPSNSMGPAIMFPLNHQFQSVQPHPNLSVLNEPPSTRIFLPGQQQSRPESVGKPVKSIHGPNFAMPVQPHQLQQFAMSFGSHQNLGIFQNLPEDTRQNIQTIPASTSTCQGNVTESSGWALNASKIAAIRSSQPTMNPNTHNFRGQIQQHLKQQQQMVFPHSLSNFPQNHSISMSQSPRMKNGSRTSSPASSTLTSLKNQHSRPPTHAHHQIAFGGNSKQSTDSHVRAPLSPSDSSVSKGSSRTTSSNSTNTKAGKTQSPFFSGNLHSNHIQKSPLQHHMFFSNPYPQAHSPHSNSAGSTTSGPNGLYMQQNIQARPNQHHQIRPSPGLFSYTSTVGGQLLPAGFSYVQLKPADQK